MGYNFLRDASYIANSELCRYDSIYGYTTDFSNNGDVNGWDIYHNIFMYGCWNNVLFGSTYLPECYLGRTEVFLSVNAEEYFFIEFLLKVVDENPNKAVKGLTKGKIMWMRTDDNAWSDDRTIEFDITGINSWEYYKLNLGPYRWWQGDIYDLRFYPFTNGHEGDKFFLKMLRITSEDVWTCSNTQCSYYQFFEHPCKGSGHKAYCEAQSYKKIYNTISGVNSELLLNIDNYGIERVELGSNYNITANDFVKIIGNNISTINIGGYSYAQVFITDEDTIRISSGTSRDDSSVVIEYTTAAVELGFFTDKEEINYITYGGEDPATGFDYASTRLLQTFELNALVDGSTDIAYVHNPTQYSVEGGRRDFNEIGTSRLISELTGDMGLMSFDNTGKTIVDLSKRVDNNGKLTHFWVYGVVYENASFKVLRPHNDGSFTVIYSKLLPQEDPDKLYTKVPIVSRVECDILVNKGDVVAAYNVDLYVGQSLTGLPDATFVQYPGDISGIVTKSTSYSYGVGGFAIYARGDLKQNNTILDIDLGYRLNVSEFVISGEELEGYFEFNIASCLDVTWDVNLFSETHDHRGTYRTTGYSWHDIHTNIYYGKDCLDDLIITADNGKAGDTYGSDNGLSTFGDHSYFYVNGDSEWIYAYDCGEITEYCGNKVPSGLAYNYQRDPIAFTLYFPNEQKFDVHKTIIYFKEENNFRKFALSAYEGPYYYKGNADDRAFTYVPEYKKIYVNGTLYQLGDNDNIDKYLFNNPTTNDLYNQDYDNWDLVAEHYATYFVDWTQLGHEFEPINCRGFRIYCNKHNSTKITEMEVYSRVDNDVSMVDNAVLYFSDYKDLWRTTGFSVVDDTTVQAFIGGTPRHFRLTLESQTKFNMRELSINVTEQIYVDDDVILLKEARNKKICAGQPIDILNTYNRPFDLTVDIPRDLGTHNNIVLWNTLNSEEDLKHTKFGPTCLLYKNEDFPITYYKGQCAVDCYTYGLVNLVHGKDAYYTYNTFDWLYYDTLASGISLDFNNTEYLGRSKFSGTMPTVSSRYWRFQAVTANVVFKISDVILTFQEERVRIRSILLPFTLNSGDNYISSDGVSIRSEDNYRDDFSNGSYADLIITGSNNPTPEVINNDYLEINPNNGTINLSTYTFNNTNDFEFIFEYELDDVSDLNLMSTTFEFYQGTTRVFYLKWNVAGSTVQTACNSTYHQFNIYVNEASVFSSTSLGCHLNTLRFNTITLRRAGANVSLYLSDHITHITTFQIDASININKYLFTSNSYIDLVNIYKILFSNTLLLSQGTWFGVELLDNNPADSVYLISSGNTSSLNVYTSYNDSSYSLTNLMDMTREDLSINFAIDLINRHSLDIIRHYGYGDLFDLSLYLNTSFSNSPGDVSEAIFDSTFEDCRWLNILVICSDDVRRNLDKLGVYTDITKVYCEGGGINNHWEYMNSSLTNHIVPTNIAYNATVSGSTYYSRYVPENAVDGETQVFNVDNCWGYEAGTTPTLYIEFDGEYRVGSFTMFSSYDPDIPYAVNKSYNFSLDNTVSGTDYNYVTVFSISGLSDNAVRNHEFDYRYARRAKLEITSFDTVVNYQQDAEGNLTYLDLGFLREIEIYAREATPEINSEAFPIIGIDLRHRFGVVSHTLYNSTRQPTKSGPSDSGNNMWDNNEVFFSYSDSKFENPDKVPFHAEQDYVIEYETTKSSGDMSYSYEYLFTTSLFLAKGHHYLDWDAYYPELVGEVSINIEGDSDVAIFATEYGVGWVSQYTEFFIPEDGYFNIYTRQNIGSDYTWGARNLKIYRVYGLTKWVVITRNTATNYSYDFDAAKFGKDYLGAVAVYGDEKYIPTEYHWWWTSDLATLYNDATNTKVGKKSLVVDYPTSSGIDVLRLKEADTFGEDKHWSINDAFCFFMYVDNIYNLDTDFGQVVIGSYHNTRQDYYYSWNLADVALDTGWNKVVLSFNEYSSIYPTNINPANKYLPYELNIQNNSEALSTFYIKYKGVGNKLRLRFDDFRIRRNRFDTDVKYNKGLCLTYSDYLMMPLSNITLDRGTVEFWVKMGVSSLCMNAFGELHAATLFTLSSNTNDIIALRVKPGSWFEIFAGNIRMQSLFNVNELPAKTFLSRGDVVHIGLVWSNDGTHIDSGHTMKLFINGVATITSFSEWVISDTKLSYFKLGGGIAQTGQIYGNHSAFIFENVKVYNYCKNSFNINQQDMKGELIHSPENFIELSKDDITYYGLGSANLPIVFEQVPSWESETVYVRTTKNSDFSTTNSTAQIIVDWLTTV